MLRRTSRYPLRPEEQSGRDGWDMKEYKLAAWPDLPAAYQRTAFRRMLSDMSQRHLTVPQLMSGSGASRLEVRLLLQLLAERGLLRERAADGSGWGPLRPIGGWIRRAIAGRAG